MKGKANWVWCSDAENSVTLARMFLPVLGKLWDVNLHGCHKQLTKVLHELPCSNNY